VDPTHRPPLEDLGQRVRLMAGLWLQKIFQKMLAFRWWIVRMRGMSVRSVLRESATRVGFWAIVQATALAVLRRLFIIT
jgi:hypothetical protein